MRRARALVVLALVAATAVALPASARTHYVELAGETTITAAHSGSVLVTVPDDAKLSWKALGNPDISIAGSGRLVGFMLEPVGQQGYSLDSVLVMRLPSSQRNALEVSGLAAPTPGPACTQPGDDPTDPLGSCEDWKDPGYGFLYEGRYRLTVLTDGAPVTIMLKLHGLDGSLDLSPATTVASTESTMSARESVGTVATSAGTAPMTMTKDGFYFVYGKVKRGPSPRYREQRLCAVDGAQADLPGAYLPPACGDGMGAVIDPMQRLPADYDGLNGGLGWGDLAAGTYGMGFNATGDSGVTFVDGAVAFLPGI
ncbi:MAG: hypothetical protein QOJ92_2224 [Frankiales bacterium]|nr:hypothetical protein [Frankiales bacterium]